MSNVEPADDERPLTEEEKTGLERLDEYDRDPDAGEAWERVRDQALREIRVGNVGVGRGYPAILHGDRLEWTGRRPAIEGPVEVLVRVAEEADQPISRAERGRRMADALRRMAEAAGSGAGEDQAAGE